MTNPPSTSGLNMSLWFPSLKKGTDMTEAKHTPGPWRFDPHRDQINWKTPTRFHGVFEPIPEKEWGALSTIIGVGIQGAVDDYWLSIQPANARLIAAAPEMLELITDVFGDGKFTVTSETPKRVRALLSRIKGE